MAARKKRGYVRRILRGNSSSRQRPPANAVQVLERGRILACQELPWGSNYSFAVLVGESDDPDDAVLAVYKPQRGEIPLWDFPDGTLYLREYSAYLMSQFLGWDFIPATTVREGPYGIGTVQLYVDPDESCEFDVLRTQHQVELQRMAIFDLIANNADRKVTHLFRDVQGKVWGIDHGLTFNVVPKLRTVLWDFCGDPLPADIHAELERLAKDTVRLSQLRRLLQPYLAAEEIEVTIQRLHRLVRAGRFPMLDPQRNYPRGFW